MNCISDFEVEWRLVENGHAYFAEFFPRVPVAFLVVAKRSNIIENDVITIAISNREWVLSDLTSHSIALGKLENNGALS
jgi:hypothetical protein